MRANRPSRTAQYTALVRALLTDKGIVDDALAVAMLTRPMRAAYEVLRRVPRMTNSPFYGALATRTLFFDGAIEIALDGGLDQVITVGAGYDSRPWRLARDGVRFFEVDHPATQEDKKRRAPRTGGPAYAACDLTAQTVTSVLGSAGVDEARPVAFVIEGVTMYLETAEVEALLTDLAHVAAPGSRLIVNFAAPAKRVTRENHVTSRVLSAAGRLQGESFRSARELDEPAALVQGTGWAIDRAASLHELAPELLGTSSGLDITHVSKHAMTVIASV